MKDPAKQHVRYIPTLSRAEILAIPCADNVTKCGRNLTMTQAGIDFCDDRAYMAWRFPFG